MSLATSQRIRFTPRALADLKNIANYTEKTWGKKQRNLYLINLNKRFEWLADNPLLGKHRQDIQAGYYSYPEGQHVIFYLIIRSYIDIIGVLHIWIFLTTFHVIKNKLALSPPQHCVSFTPQKNLY